MEALSHQFDSMQQRTKDAYAELDRRLQPLEPQQRTVDGIQSTVQPGGAEDFDTALLLFPKRDFKHAEAQFKNFVSQCPASPYQPTDHYWLGNALYAHREYKSAIPILERVVKRY